MTSSRLSAKPRAYSYVRLSTDIQAKGHGRSRQRDLAQQYAEEHNLELQDQFRLEDIGVSAFKGDNVVDGALGRFLDAIKKGTIAPGSFLLVESLDRISRQEVLKAVSVFLQIVNAGITIVTLSDGRAYRPDDTNLHDLLYSLLIMARAHEESLTKSKRVAAAWGHKRNQASSKPMTKICPSWLRLSSDRKAYEPVQERVEIVRSMFADASNGIGIFSIARRLNQESIPTFNESDGWHASYIAKILSNRATIGEFQPHVRVNGKRVPSGEVIRNYYPSVVPDDLFYRAQAGRIERLQSGRGRKGRFVSNLFSGLAKCTYCRGPMKFENKGSGPKGAQYLVCERAKRLLGCVSTRWRYLDFETSFLTFVRELDLRSALSAPEDGEHRSQIDAEIDALAGQIATQRALMEKTFVLLKSGAAIEFVSEKLSQQQAELASLEARLKSLEDRRRALIQAQEAFRRGKEELSNLVGRVQEQVSEENFELRSLVSARLRDLVTTVDVAAAGRRPITERVISELKSQDAADWNDVVRLLERENAEEKNNARYFGVGFRDGSVRIVTPAPNDPREYTEQLVSNAHVGLEKQTPNDTLVLFAPGEKESGGRKSNLEIT